MPGLCWEVGIFCQLQNLLFSFITWEKKRIIDPILQVKKLCVIGDHTARKGQSWYPKSGLLILNCMLSCGSIMTHSTFFFCQASSAYYFKIQFHIFGAIGHQVLTFAKVFFCFYSFICSTFIEHLTSTTYMQLKACPSGHQVLGHVCYMHQVIYSQYPMRRAIFILIGTWTEVWARLEFKLRCLDFKAGPLECHRTSI